MAVAEREREDPKWQGDREKDMKTRRHNCERQKHRKTEINTDEKSDALIEKRSQTLCVAKDAKLKRRQGQSSEVQTQQGRGTKVYKQTDIKTGKEVVVVVRKVEQ